MVIMKNVNIALCGSPAKQYRPVAILATNDKIRRTAEQYANKEKYDYAWIDKDGNATDENAEFTDLYVETNAYVCEIQNSSYRAR